MTFINYQSKEINCKIIYFGPARSGKTRSLKYIYEQTKPENRGEMITLQAQDESTLYFDFIPLFLGEIRGFRARLHLYAMPGAVGSSLNQRLILKGLDGIVFVADSSPDRLEENIDCLDSLEDILIGLNKNPSDMPMVFQFNKQDLPGAMPVDKLSSLLNLRKAPQYPSNARGGNGVLPVLKEISKRVLSGLGNIGD